MLNPHFSDLSREQQRLIDNTYGSYTILIFAEAKRTWRKSETDASFKGE